MPVFQPLRPVLRALVAVGVALVLLLIAARPRPAQALDPSCDNPQDAARSLLDWLQPDRWDPKAAARCLGMADGDPKKAAETAVKLKEVLDARGLYVPVTEMSLDPDYRDDRGLHRAVPLASFPLLALVKRDGQWVFSRDIVQAVDPLYDETFSGLSGQVQKRVPGAWDRRVLNVRTWQWISLGLLLGVALLLGLLAQMVFADQAIRFARRAHIRLNPKVIAGMRGPISAFLVGTVFIWGVPDLRLGVQASRIFLFAANTLASFAAVLVLVRLVDLGADYFAKQAADTRSKMDDQVIPLVQRALKAGVWCVGVVFVVQNMGVDVGSLIAGLGIGGLAFALAAKDTVENLFGSLTIFTDRPFQIGDWIVLDGGLEGVVEEVGFRSTRIRTFHNSVVSVPNGKLASSRIDNMGQRRYRRVKTSLGLTYDTPPARIDAFLTRVRAYLRANPSVWNGTCEVRLNNFSSSSLDVLLYFFLDVPDWSHELAERERCLLALLEIAQELGVSYAFPSTSLYVEKLPEGFAAAG